MGIQLDELNQLKKKILPEDPSNYPEHGEITKSLQAMGYYGNIGGICAGIAELANLFCVMGRQDEYKLRMRLIKSLLSGYTLDDQGILQPPSVIPPAKTDDYENLKVQFAKIETKLAKKGFNQLTAEEQIIYEMVHFLQDIQLHFKPQTYPEIFSEGMDQHKVEEVSKLTTFKIEDPMDQFKGIEKICADPTVKTKAELDTYFTDLKNDIETIDPPETQKQLSFTIDSLNHRIMVNYQGHDKWLFVDANQLGASGALVATADIGKKIRDAMEHDFPDEDRFPLNIMTYAASNNAQEVRNKLSRDHTNKNSLSKANKITQDEAQNIVGLVHDQHMDLTKIKKVIDILYIKNPANKYDKYPSPYPTEGEFVTEINTLLAGDINKKEYIKFLSGAMELADYKKVMEAVILIPHINQSMVTFIQDNLNKLSDKKSQFAMTKLLLKKSTTLPGRFIDSLHQKLQDGTIKMEDTGKALIESYSGAAKRRVLALGAQHGVNIIENNQIILQDGKFALDEAYDWKGAATHAALYGQADFINEMKDMLRQMTAREKITLMQHALSHGKADFFEKLEKELVAPVIQGGLFGLNIDTLHNSDYINLAKAAAKGGCFEILQKIMKKYSIELTTEDNRQKLAEAAIEGGRFQELFDTARRAEAAAKMANKEDAQNYKAAQDSSKNARASANEFKKFLTTNNLGGHLAKHTVSKGVRGVISSLVENEVIKPPLVLHTTLETSAADVLNEYKNTYNATYGNKPAAKKPTQEQQEKLRNYPQIMEEIALSASRKGLEDIVITCYKNCLEMESLANTFPTIPPVRADETALNAMRILITNGKDCKTLSTEIAKSAVERGKSEVIRELLKIFANAKLKNGGALAANGQAAWDELVTKAESFVKDAHAKNDAKVVEVLVRNNLLALDKCTIEDYKSITDSILASAKKNWNISDMVQWQKELDERLKIAQGGAKAIVEGAKQDATAKYTATMEEIVTAVCNAGVTLLGNDELKARAMTPTEMKLLDKQLRTFENVCSLAMENKILIDLNAQNELAQWINAGAQVAEEFLKNPDVAMSDNGKDTLRKYATWLYRVSSRAVDHNLKEIMIESYKKITILNEGYMLENQDYPLFDIEEIAHSTINGLLNGISKGGTVDGIVALADLQWSPADLLAQIAIESTKKYLDPINSADAEEYKEILTQTAKSALSKYQNIYDDTYGAQPSKEPNEDEKKDLEFFSTILINILKEEGLNEVITKEVIAPLHQRWMDNLSYELEQINSDKINNSPDIKEAAKQHKNSLDQLENLGARLKILGKIGNVIQMVDLTQSINCKKEKLHSSFKKKLEKEIRDEIMLHPAEDIAQSKTMEEAETLYNNCIQQVNYLQGLERNLPSESRSLLITERKETLKTFFKERVAAVENIKAASQAFMTWFNDPNSDHGSHNDKNAQAILKLIKDNYKEPILKILSGTQTILKDSGNKKHSYSRFLHDKLVSGEETVNNQGIDQGQFKKVHRKELEAELRNIIKTEEKHQDIRQLQNEIAPQSQIRPHY